MASRLNHLAGDAQARYGLMLNSLRGVYAAAARGATSPTVIGSAHEAALTIGKVYLDTESQHVRADGYEIALEAHQRASRDLGLTSDAKLPEALSDQLIASGEHLIAQLARQVEQDIATMDLGIRRMGFEIRALAQARGVNYEAAGVQYRAIAPAPSEFFIRDRLGRRLQSDKNARTMWRQHLVLTSTESYLFTAAAAGHERVRLNHTDPNHPAYGLEIDIFPGGKGQAYQDIRESIFHPNSDVTVAAIK